MKVTLIEYPKCSTCKKAKKWLQDNNIKFEDRDIIEKTPTKNELTEWILKSENQFKGWFNTSGMKYRELNLKDKLPKMDDNEKIELLANDGMLIKRPILIVGDQICTGFKEVKWKEILKLS